MQNIIPISLMSLSGVLLFIAESSLLGYLVISVSVLLGFLTKKELGKDLLIVGTGLVIMSLVAINTDISYKHMLEMGVGMTVILVISYVLSRYVYGDYSIRFPWHFGLKWSKQQWLYIALVLIAGYLILPAYMIGSGVYENWPAAREPGEIARLFLGTNALGIWDELFFICVVFVLYQKHLSFWPANILQAVLFTSFLYELGFESYGPALIYVFALIQGFIFQKTHSLFYIVTVHLSFDFILFLVLLHAHTRELFPIFLY